jgi:NAD(P)-dependent dehydrogenase (short-subunit alcohol dehydrogenase family)
MQLENTVALITGGSQGLGLALARALGKRGVKVALMARDAARLERVQRALAAEGIRVQTVAADVADKEAIYPSIGQLQATLGPIDILVHNASSLGHVPLRPLLDTECEVLEQTLATNLVGPFRLSKALAPGMVLRGQGALVHISSDAAVNAYPSWGAYGTSKAALDHLARHFAAELEGSGVSVLSVDPGEMDTAMHRDALPDADPSSLARPEAVAERIVALISAEPSRHHGQRRVIAELESVEVPS